MGSTEVRAQQTSAIAAPPPTWNTSSGLRSDQQTKDEIISEELKAGLHVGDPDKSPSEFDITVRIDRSVMRDARQPYGDQHIDQDLYATPLSVLGCSQDYDV
jgi:hypothetical protein